MVQHSSPVIRNHAASAATNARPQIYHVDGHHLWHVQVEPAGFPVDAKVIHQKPGGPKETRTEFYVRVANGTNALEAVKREKRILSRWVNGVGDQT
ncbi:MAG: hypothetical protein M3P48_09680 [Actinomycetota bacterium]|nr:hypothetical protein [Actinomycetota bacterium]